MPKTIITQFMRAFANGLLGQVADKVADICFLAGPLFVLLGKNSFSVKKIIAAQWESITIVVIGVSGLVIWHAIRSALEVAAEAKQENLTYGFNASRERISFVGTKLTGIVLVLAGTMLGLSYLSWTRIPKVTEEAHPSESSEPPKPKLLPIKNPLKIIAFRSDYGIAIENDGPLPVYVVALQLKTKMPDQSKSFGLGANIEAGKVSEIRLHDERDIPKARSLRKLAGTWEEHVRKAQELYAGCGMELVFFSPLDHGFQEIRRSHLEHGQPLGYENISGVLYYRVQSGGDKQSIPLIMTIAVNDAGCPHL